MQTKKTIVGYAIYRVNKNGEIVIEDNKFHRGKLCGGNKSYMKIICEHQKVKIGKFSVTYTLEEEVKIT